MKRLFFALELPAVIRAALAEIDPEIKNVRWNRIEQMHLTLSFLGNVDAEHEEWLREAVDAVRVPSFFLRVQGVGTFGGSRPTVLWAGVGSGHPHLFALHKHLQDALLRARIEPDLRAFHPHITLARLRGVAAAVVRPFLREHGEDDFGMFAVREFVLFSSEPGPEGSTYVAELRTVLD